MSAALTASPSLFGMVEEDEAEGPCGGGGTKEKRRSACFCSASRSDANTIGFSAAVYATRDDPPKEGARNGMGGSGSGLWCTPSTATAEKAKKKEKKRKENQKRFFFFCFSLLARHQQD